MIPTTEELKTFFDNSLKKQLDPLENQRLQTVKNLSLLNLFLVMFLIAANLSFIWLNFFSFVLAILVLLAWAYFLNKIIKSYKNNFKIIVLPKLVNFIDKNLIYSPLKSVSKESFKQSNLFKENPDRFTGENLVEGKIEGVTLSFSEIKSEISEIVNKNKTNIYKKIFKGKFFVIKLEKEINGEIIILPKNIITKPINKKTKGLKALKNHQKTKPLTFDKTFTITTSQSLDKSLLTPDFIKLITDYKNIFNRDIFISINSNFFIAINYPKNLFNPTLFQSLIDFNLFSQYLEDLRLVVNLSKKINY